MNFDINAIIFIVFLAANFIFGRWTSRGVNTLRGYAIGDKNFSTATLVATIVATWVSGGFFFTIVSETYANGAIYMTLLLGEFLGLIFIGSLLAPRMGEFLGKLSIAEAMGGLFGREVRVITAVAGFVGVAGTIAVQLKASGLIFEYALGIKPFYGIVFSGTIITLYSSLGGIKSVTLTDVIQFATFSMVIPLIAYFLLGNVDNHQVILDTLNTSPVFNYKTVFSFSNPEIYLYITLFIWCMIPTFKPPYFQRIAMAKNTAQAGRSFKIAGFICLFLSAIVCWVGILMLSSHPNMEKEEIFKIIITNSAWIVGFKGIILIGIMAMVMSTIDSYINSTSVLIVHDLRKALNLSAFKNELFATRIGAMLIGLLAILFAMREGGLLNLSIWANMFYMPIVDVPFILAILGFRSSTRAVISGMVSGFLTAITWEKFFKIHDIPGLIPGIFANLIVYFAVHYIFKQSGGWVGIKDKAPLIEARRQRTVRNQKLLGEIKSFNLLNVFIKNTPKGDGLIFFLGLLVMVSTFISVTSLSNDIKMHHAYWINVFYPIILCSSSILMSYPLWLGAWRQNPAILAIVWNVIMFASLICFSFLNVLISHFSEVQLMAFMANIMLVSFILSWRWALTVITSGILAILFFFKAFVVEDICLIESSPVEFKIVYLLLIINSLIIICLKPKQDYVEATENKVEVLEIALDDLEIEVGELEYENVNLGQEVTQLNVKVNDLGEKMIHYTQRVKDQAVEIERLGATAQKILNNVNHELRLPVGNVVNFAEMLSSGLEKYNKKQLKQLSDEVFKNSTRLSTMILNMLDLAVLDAKKIELNKQNINLSELVEDRVNHCRKIYLQDKKIDIKFEIEPNVLVNVDANYIRQTVDNLVINAITYSNSGEIKVSVLRQGKDMVEFVIQDEGIGIPKSQLYDIFTPFKMGIHTESKAEGRGVGLALCKAAIDAHGGSINVFSNGTKGASFRVSLASI